jgi:hypothetical protein
MNHLNQIQCMLVTDEIWRVYFFSIGLLGIYFSAILIGFVKARDLKNVFLGLYLLSISMLLIHLSSIIYQIDLINEVLKSVAAGSLFLIGPFSYLMFQRDGKRQTNTLFTIQFIPAVLAMVFVQIIPHSESWIYPLGLIHIGCYLFCQSIMVFKKGGTYLSGGSKHKIIQNKWYKNYNLIQVLLFMTICIAYFTCEIVFCYVFASISIVVLILLIWIRLLQSAGIKYLK